MLKKKNQWILCFLCGDITSHTGSPQSLPEGEIKNDSQPLEIYTEAAVYLICGTVPRSAASKKTLSLPQRGVRIRLRAMGPMAINYGTDGVWHTVGVSRIRLQDKRSFVYNLVHYVSLGYSFVAFCSERDG